MSTVVGQTIVASVVFDDPAGVALDVLIGTVTCAVSLPSQPSVALTPVRDSAGHFHALHTPATPGRWTARFEGVDPVTPSIHYVHEYSYDVTPRKVPAP